MARLQQLKDDAWAGEQAKGELWRTCSNEKLLAELADVQEQLHDARHEVHRLRTLETVPPGMQQSDSARPHSRLSDRPSGSFASRYFFKNARSSFADVGYAERLKTSDQPGA